MNAPRIDTTAQSEARKGPVELKSRSELRDLLISAGLARGAAEKISRGGWPALVGEPTEQDLLERGYDVARKLLDILGDKT